MAIADCLQDLGTLVRTNGGCELVPAKLAPLQQLGIDPARPHKREGAIAKACNDWSERRPHIAGPLGVAIADRLHQLGWIEKLPQPRAVRLTDQGKDGLREMLDI